MRDKQKHIAGEAVLCKPDAYIRFLYLRVNPYQPIWEVFILNFPKVAPPPKQTKKPTCVPTNCLGEKDTLSY